MDTVYLVCSVLTVRTFSRKIRKSAICIKETHRSTINSVQIYNGC